MNKKITCITGNKNKFAEIKQMLWSDFDLDQVEIDLPEIQSLDSSEVIEAKLDEVKIQVEGIFFVEDTCLVVDAYGGWLPEPLIKWFIEDKKQWLDNIVEYAKFKNNYKAKAITTIGLLKDWEKYYFQWIIEWTITDEIKVNNDFCWDPIFIPNGSHKTFAEMELGEKSMYSMRQIAVNKMKNFLVK